MLSNVSNSLWCDDRSQMLKVSDLLNTISEIKNVNKNGIITYIMQKNVLFWRIMEVFLRRKYVNDLINVFLLKTVKKKMFLL